jgi:transcriptional regulator with XRE-family HTH domain
MRGLTSGLTLGERIAWYRRRRGLSQEVVAGLVGRTVDWLSKVENSRIEIDRVSVIRSLSDALDVSVGDLLNEPSLVEWTSDSGSRTVPAVRAALMDYRQIMGMPASTSGDEPIPFAELERDLNEVWLAYQDSRFGFVTSRVPQLIADSQVAAGAYDGDESARAHAILALTYQAAAVTLTKVGEQDLAWIASDRGLVAAQRSNDVVIQGSLFRSVTHSLLSTGRYNEAVQMTEQATAVLEPHLANAGAEMLSVYGTLLLAGSMAAARAENRSMTMDLLNLADELARRLGSDANHLWTAFGPTNVAIHRVSTAMELGDVQLAVDTGPRIDTTSLPVERQVRHALEVARALSMRNRRQEALATVLEAEQTAPEQVRYHFISRHLVQTWIRQQRGKPSFHLTGLAERLRVV